VTAQIVRPSLRKKLVSHPTRRILTSRLVDESQGLAARRPVIAAVTGFRGELGPETVDAVRWAAYEASVRSVALEVVSVVDWKQATIMSVVACATNGASAMVMLSARATSERM